MFGEELKRLNCDFVGQGHCSITYGRMQDERNERYCSKKVGEVIDQPPPSEMSEFPQDKEQCKGNIN